MPKTPFDHFISLVALLAGVTSIIARPIHIYIYIYIYIYGTPPPWTLDWLACSVLPVFYAFLPYTHAYVTALEVVYGGGSKRVSSQEDPEQRGQREGGARRANEG